MKMLNKGFVKSYFNIVGWDRHIRILDTDLSFSDQIFRGEEMLSVFTSYGAGVSML